MSYAPLDPTAYDSVAARYRDYSNANAYNALCERPSTLSLLPEVRGKTVLDASCGPGFYAEWCLRRGASVVAFDSSSAMIELAHETLGAGVSVHRADLNEPLRFLPAESVDAVICALALDYAKDLSVPIGEFHRVLVRAGYFIFSVEHPRSVFRRCGTIYAAQELVSRESQPLGCVDRFFRRPRRAYIDALATHGFTLENVLTATLQPECETKFPDIFAKLAGQPLFLCFRARK